MRTRNRLTTLLACGLAAATLAAGPAAHADDDDEDEDDRAGATKIAADLEYLFVEGDLLDDGLGGALRIGREFDAFVLSVTPELGGSYHSLSGPLDASLYRGLAGLRLSVGKVLEPGVFGHVGYGRIEFDESIAGVDLSHGGFTYDVGATLDFTLLPVLDVGAHVAYNGLTGENEMEDLNWVTLGGHASVQF